MKGNGKWREDPVLPARAEEGNYRGPGPCEPHCETYRGGTGEIGGMANRAIIANISVDTSRYRASCGKCLRGKGSYARFDQRANA